MKRFFQFVSILAIGLLMGPAGFEAVLCGSVGQSTPCPMAIHDMGPDCPMAGPTASLNFPQNCCAQRCLPQVLPWARPVKPKVAILQTAIMPLVLLVASPVRVLAKPIDASASSPPRFILYRVFRI